MSLTPDNKSLYKISSALDQNMCLDSSQKQGHLNQLILYDFNNGPNQKFAIRSLPDNKFAFFCSLNNGTIEVPNGSTNEGQKIRVDKPNKSLNQFWQLVPVNQPEYNGQNAFYIKSFCGQALDVCNAKAKKGQQIIQWKFTGGKNQIWFIQKV